MQIGTLVLFYQDIKVNLVLLDPLNLSQVVECIMYVGRLVIWWVTILDVFLVLTIQILNFSFFLLLFLGLEVAHKVEEGVLKVFKEVLGELVLVDTRLLSLVVVMVSVMVSLGDLRQSPMMQLLQVLSQFSILLLICYPIYFASCFDDTYESLILPIYVSTLVKDFLAVDQKYQSCIVTLQGMRPMQI